MLDNFKSLKKINNMRPGEEAYIQVGGLLTDEYGRFWINLEAKVSLKGGGFLSPMIRRTGIKTSDFEIDDHNAYTPFTVESDKLENDNSCVCLEEDTKEIVYKFEKNNATHDSVKEKLSPLYEIFLNPGILNQVLINTNIPEIIRGDSPVFSGVILYGEGGTGKTSLQRAIGRVYKNCGAISEELHVAAMSEKYIGSLGNNLDKKIKEINIESEKQNVPAFIFLDEATSLVMSRESHNSSGADYYQEAVDVLKKYISNYPNLVFSVTTNAQPDIYDDTLVREGRLAPVQIPAPGKDEKIKMWEFFLKKYDIFEKLSIEQYEKLALLTRTEKGSFISEFTKSYLLNKKLDQEKNLAESESVLDALTSGNIVSMDMIKSGINFTELIDDLKKSIQESFNRKQVKVNIGF
ncbi:MAG: AAA family ATPase [Thermodesulfobacteriota bacterium]